MRMAWRAWRRLPLAAQALLVLSAVVAVVLAAPVGEQVDPGSAAGRSGAAEPRVEDSPAPAEPAGSPSREAVAPILARVDRVIDGDTIALDTGARVRLVQIDAPEVRGAECHAAEATALLEALIPAGTEVQVETDPALDQVDRYGRTLAYVVKGGENVNLTLVREGAASVWFYRGARGRYATELLAAAEEAQAAGRGLWGACDAILDPLSALSTAPRSGSDAAPDPVQAAVAVGTADADAGCHPAYAPCLPILADMNCPAVRALGKAPVTVRTRGFDPYHLDGDGDGIGCQ